jgi:hypothetical protein
MASPEKETVAPWIDAGLLFGPRMRRDKSASSHECTFVSIDDRWVWEHGIVIKDEMRQVPGPRTTKQSLTVLPGLEGSKVDMVMSASRSGSSCQIRRGRSFQVRNGTLVEVATRSRLVP